MTDSITDMLNRIRNAQAVSKKTVIVPFSKLKFQILKVLEREGFIERVEEKGRKQRRVINIWLKYRVDDNDKINLRSKPKGIISGLKRISRPGQRNYGSVKDITKNKKRYGLIMISTPKGIMTDKDAKEQNVGGELLFEIW